MDLETQAQRDGKQTYRTTAGPALVMSENMARYRETEPSPWQDQIPTGAIFYDKMTRLEKGLDVPGLLLSVRI